MTRFCRDVVRTPIADSDMLRGVGNPVPSLEIVLVVKPSLHLIDPLLRSDHSNKLCPQKDGDGMPRVLASFEKPRNHPSNDPKTGELRD